MIAIPNFEPVVVFGDDAKLLAEISSFFRRDGCYLAISDGPRMSRIDWTNEAVRRSNLVAQIQARQAWLPTSITRKGVVVEASLTRYLRVRLDARSSGVVTKWSKVTVCKTVSTGSNPVDASIFS